MSKSSASDNSKRARATTRRANRFSRRPKQTSAGPVHVRVISQQQPLSREALDIYETLQVMTLEDLEKRGLIA